MKKLGMKKKKDNFQENIVKLFKDDTSKTVSIKSFSIEHKKENGDFALNVMLNLEHSIMENIMEEVQEMIKEFVGGTRSEIFFDDKKHLCYIVAVVKENEIEQKVKVFKKLEKYKKN